MIDVFILQTMFEMVYKIETIFVVKCVENLLHTLHYLPYKNIPRNLTSAQLNPEYFPSNVFHVNVYTIEILYVQVHLYTSYIIRCWPFFSIYLPYIWYVRPPHVFGVFFFLIGFVNSQRLIIKYLCRYYAW